MIYLSKGMITICGIVGEKMPQVLDKSYFSVVFKSASAEDSSERWQERCQQSYDLIYRNFPEGSIEPLNLEDARRERGDLVTIFSTLVAAEIYSINPENSVHWWSHV